MRNFFDTDRFREIAETLTRNKSRSILTGFGIFWGIFMLLSLIGGGHGLKEMLSNNFEGFASNAAFLFASNTSKPYKGFRKFRSWNMTYTDVDRLKNQIPELDAVSPVLSFWGGNALYDSYKASCSIKGIRPDYTRIETPQMYYGRYINEMDVLQERKVCVIGKRVYNTLFPKGGDPCGEFIRVGGIHYQIVGVDWNSGNISINGNTQTTVVLPISVMQKAYNYGNNVHLICITGKEGVKIKPLEGRIREVIAREHYIDPADQKALFVFNTELMFGIMDSLFKGVNFLIWLVGLGTILAGAIGVSNIMIVTVKERTSEIGIRRAIGATPRMILSQIIVESIVLTVLAGGGGIVLAVAVLNGADAMAFKDGIQTAHFQVDFYTALLSVGLLTVLGVLAGLAPATRAMQIKPVDAMRDE